MKHATKDDLRMIEGLLGGGGGDGSITLRRDLAAALVDEIHKHRAHATKAERSAGTVEIGTILSSRTKTGAINFYVDGHAFQVDVGKAREIAGMLTGAIEAAISDELIYKFLTATIGLSDDAAGRALLDFRELRQGSRGTVYPT